MLVRREGRADGDLRPMGRRCQPKSHAHWLGKGRDHTSRRGWRHALKVSPQATTRTSFPWVQYEPKRDGKLSNSIGGQQPTSAGCCGNYCVYRQVNLARSNYNVAASTCLPAGAPRLAIARSLSRCEIANPGSSFSTTPPHPASARLRPFLWSK